MNGPETSTMLNRRLVLESINEAIHQVENEVDIISAELEFKADVYANVMVAVTEAVNNGIIHGNKSDSGKKVYVEFEMKNSYCLCVRVRDEGDGFDPEELPDPTAPENLENIGGRGVFLMRQLSDRLSFADDGREVEMVFNI